MTHLRVERPADGVVRLVLDRPEKRNALDDDMLLRLLPDTCLALAADDSVRAVVVTGEGADFCAGADLTCSGFDQPTPRASEQYLQATHRTPLTLQAMTKPVIAAVTGAAVGAGLGLALACDIRLADPTARFIAPLARMGLPPDYATSYLLPRLVGPDIALELFLTGRSVGAAEALQLRMVTRVVADVRGEALALAVRLAGNSPTATAATKRLVAAAVHRDAVTAVQDEITTVAGALHGQDAASRIAAWRRKVAGGR